MSKVSRHKSDGFTFLEYIRLQTFITIDKKLLSWGLGIEFVQLINMKRI